MDSRELQLVLKVQDDASKELQKVAGEIKNVEKATGSFSKTIESMQPAFKKMAIAGTAGFAAITAGIGLTVKAFAESQAQLAIVDSIIGTLTEDTLAQFEGGLEGAKKAAREFGAEMQAMGGIGDETASEGFVKLLQVTKDVTKATDAARIAADLAKFKNIDYGTSIDIITKVLSGQTAALSRYGIVLEEGATVEEAMAEIHKRTAGQYEAFGKTVAGQTEILSQSFGDLKENLGQAFLPALQQLFTAVQPVLDTFVKWTAENPKLVTTITGIALAVTGFLAVVGTLGLVIPSLIAGFSALATAASFLGGAILAITWPVALIIAGIAALGAAVYLLWKNWDTVTATMVDAWNTVKDAITSSIEAIGAALTAGWEAIKSGFWTTVNFLIGAFATLMDFFLPGWQGMLTGMITAATELLGALFEVIGTKFEEYKAYLLTFFQIISEAWGAMWEGMKNVFSEMWGAIKAIFDSVVQGITEAMDKLLAPIQKVIDKAERALELAGGAIKSVGSSIKDGISAIISRGSSLTGKATGGGVTARTPYMVGERGPELFIPAQHGTITPNYAMAGAGPTGGININIYGDVTGQEIIDKVSKAIMSRVKDRMRI